MITTAEIEETLDQGRFDALQSRMIAKALELSLRREREELQKILMTKEDGARLLERITEGEQNLRELIAGSEKQLRELIAHNDRQLRELIAHNDQQLRERIAEGETRLLERIIDGEKQLAALIAETRADIAESKSDMIKWMFLFWVGLVPIIAAIFKLLK